MRPFVTSLLIVFATITNAAPKVITLGHIANFSSESDVSIDPLNSAYSDAAKMALLELEKEFEKLKTEVRILNFNHGPKDSDVPGTTMKALESNIVGLVGYYESGKAMAALNLLKDKGLMTISPTASAVSISEKNYIRTLSISNRQMAEQMANIAKSQIRARKVMVVADSDCTYCSDLDLELVGALKKADIQGIHLKTLSTDESYEAVLKRAMSERFDAVILPNQEVSSARLINSFLKRGIVLPFIGGDGWGNAESQKFFDVVTDKRFVGYSIGHWHPDRSSPMGKRFAKKWAERFYKNPTNDWAMAYEATRFSLLSILDLLKEKKTVTRQAFFNKISQAKHYEGITGEFRFQDIQLPPQRPVIVLKSNTKRKRFDPLILVVVGITL